MQVSEPPSAVNPIGQASGALSTSELTAVIVDWNLPDYTTRCVQALVEDGIPADRVVVGGELFPETVTLWNAVR